MVAAVGDGSSDDDHHPGDGHQSPTSADQDPAYFQRVVGEIDEEVQRRRVAGDLTLRAERELDDLFAAVAPTGGAKGTGAASEALRLVDASAFINPVVPVASDRSGGAAIKRSIRSASLWYVGFVTQQINEFTSSVSRCLHVLEGRLGAVETELVGMRPAAPVVVDVPWAQHEGAWWVAPAVDALRAAPGRVLHSACGNGWLVGALARAGIEAYGVDPRAEPVDARADGPGPLDLRVADPDDHLRTLPSGRLGGVVLSGLTESMSLPQVELLLDLVVGALAPGGVLAVHWIAPSWWASDDGPATADRVAGHPLRPATWEQLLSDRGFEATVSRDPGASTAGPSGPEGPARGPIRDYLAVARRPLPAGSGGAP